MKICFGEVVSRTFKIGDETARKILKIESGDRLPHE